MARILEREPVANQQVSHKVGFVKITDNLLEFPDADIIEKILIQINSATPIPNSLLLGSILRNTCDTTLFEVAYIIESPIDRKTSGISETVSGLEGLNRGGLDGSDGADLARCTAGLI
ncbi:hypothetical protein ACVDFE_17720 [Lentzea chajnantorensis]